MKSLLQSAFPALILGMFMAPAHAQVGAGNYDLSDYTLESTHGIWQVLCTAPGSGSRHNQERPCAKGYTGRNVRRSSPHRAKRPQGRVQVGGALPPAEAELARPSGSSDSPA